MRSSFSSRGFAVVEQLFDDRLARILFQVLLLRRWRGESKRDQQVPAAFSFWGDATLDAVLLVAKPEVEKVVGRRLLPTYAYARLYVAGNQLPRHRDREACEIAVTVHLGHTGSVPPPPIHFEGGIVVCQRAGDAVVYPGSSLEHWRDTFNGESFGQVFLNYVFADGAQHGILYDGRRDAFPPGMHLGMLNGDD